ncbi:MAG: cell division protein FtsL [Deltaproteobacteria bacterium]|nr:MAG: cell division protein FtsL [Deltaproteobacteria bacterium]
MTETTLGALPKINGFSLRRPRLLPTFGFIGLLCVLSIFFVWCRVQATGLEYEISSLEEAVRKANQETVELRLEVATLSTPQRLEQVALRDLGLRFPTPAQVKTVD